MDAFVTRAPSAGPSRTRDGAPSKRLPSSSAIPSFFAQKSKTSHMQTSSGNDKGKGRASTEGPAVTKHGYGSPLSARAQSVPAAHSSKVGHSFEGASIASAMLMDTKNALWAIDTLLTARGSFISIGFVRVSSSKR